MRASPQIPTIRAELRTAAGALDRRVLEQLKPHQDLVSRLAAEIRAGDRVDLDNLAIAARPGEMATPPIRLRLKEPAKVRLSTMR